MGPLPDFFTLKSFVSDLTVYYAGGGQSRLKVVSDSYEERVKFESVREVFQYAYDDRRVTVYEKRKQRLLTTGKGMCVRYESSSSHFDHTWRQFDSKSVRVIGGHRLEITDADSETVTVEAVIYL